MNKSLEVMNMQFFLKELAYGGIKSCTMENLVNSSRILTSSIFCVLHCSSKIRDLISCSHLMVFSVNAKLKGRKKIKLNFPTGLMHVKVSELALIVYVVFE